MYLSNLLSVHAFQGPISCQVLDLLHPQSSHNTTRESLSSPSLQIRKLRFREIKKLAQGHKLENDTTRI